MAYTIAVAGKGGTGKTTITAVLIDYLVRRHKRSILALDADPNANLNEALGIKSVATISGILSYTAKLQGDLPAGISKSRFIEYELQNSITAGLGFDLLAIGNPEGPACYCAANSVLRRGIERLSGSYNYVVIDNEAGMEHFIRKASLKIDLFLIIGNPTTVGIRSAKRISTLAKEAGLKIRKEYVLINKVKGGIGGLKEGIAEAGLTFGCAVPFYSGIENFNLENKPVFGTLQNFGDIEIIFDEFREIAKF